MDVSIIIVNYNTKDLLLNCIDSIYKHTKSIDFEIIVSDNGSVDGSIELVKEKFPAVIVIENGENLGFGAANNRATKLAKGNFIFFLNSDTIICNNAVKIFYDYWNSSPFKDSIGALGTNLKNIEGKNSISFASFPDAKKEYKYLIHCFLSSLYVKKILYLFKAPTEVCKKVGKVDFLIGADLFVRNNEYAFFDERYFMYYEESDLQLRMSRNGFSMYCIDGPDIIHFEGGSSNNKKLIYDFKKKTSNYYWKSCLLYLEKNLPDSLLYQEKIKKLLKFIYKLPWNK